MKYTGGSAELEFFVEGLRFPDDSFGGLVTVHVSLLEALAEVRWGGRRWRGGGLLGSAPAGVAGAALVGSLGSRSQAG